MAVVALPENAPTKVPAVNVLLEGIYDKLASTIMLSDGFARVDVADEGLSKIKYDPVFVSPFVIASSEALEDIPTNPIKLAFVVLVKRAPVKLLVVNVLLEGTYDKPESTIMPSDGFAVLDVVDVGLNKIKCDPVFASPFVITTSEALEAIPTNPIDVLDAELVKRAPAKLLVVNVLLEGTYDKPSSV